MRHFTAAGCTLAVLVVCMLAREAQAGETFVLGGFLVGWTNKGDVDYDKWISKYRVKIGDTVAWVRDLWSFRGEVNPMTIGQGIKYTVTFAISGPYYFICAVPGHCLQGMKVHVEVLNADGTMNTTAAAATPGRISAAPAMPGFSWTLQLMIMVVATFSLMVAATTM